MTQSATHLDVTKQLQCGALAVLGEQVLLQLADGPLHAGAFIILLILLLNGHIGEVHVQILQIGLI